MAAAVLLLATPTSIPETEDSGSPQILGFTAAYETPSGREQYLTFGTAAEIMDRDESIVPGYVLDRRLEGFTADRWSVSEYLDENLLLFRWDWTTDCRGETCTNVRWTQALPSFTGLDIPHQMEERGHLSYWLGTQAVEFVPGIEETPEGTWYRLDDSVLPPHAQGISELTGEYLFDDDLPVPIEFRLDLESNDSYALRSFEWGDPLPAIDNPSRQPGAVESRGREGWLFPGEDEDTFGIGATHRELIRGLISHDTVSGDGSMQEALDAGACVRTYRLSKWFAADPVEDPVHYLHTMMVPSGYLRLDLQEPENHKIHGWQSPFTVRGPVTLFERIDEFEAEHWHTCHDAGDFGWPALALDEAIAWANEYVQPRHEMDSIRFQRLPVDPSAADPAYGWNYFVIYYDPDTTNFPGYYVAINADRLEFNDMIIETADIDFPPYPG